MAIERWELLLSSKEDRYLLKLRGDKADVDRIVRTHPNVCHEPQSISDPVFQWVLFVVGATFAERLAIQNQVISLSSAHLQAVGQAGSAGRDVSDELSNVLGELSSVLEELTDLTSEEEAHVLKKMQQIHQREADVRARPPAPPPSPRPGAAPFAPASRPVPPGMKPPPPAAPPPSRVIQTPSPGAGSPAGVPSLENFLESAFIGGAPSVPPAPPPQAPRVPPPARPAPPPPTAAPMPPTPPPFVPPVRPSAPVTPTPPPFVPPAPPPPPFIPPAPPPVAAVPVTPAPPPFVPPAPPPAAVAPAAPPPFVLPPTEVAAPLAPPVIPAAPSPAEAAPMPAAPPPVVPPPAPAAPPAAVVPPVPSDQPDTFTISSSTGTRESAPLEIIRHPQAVPSTPATPPAPPAAPKAADGPMEIVLNFDAASVKAGPPPAPPAAAPETPAEAPEPSVPEPIQMPQVQTVADLPVVASDVPDDQLLKATIFFPAGGEASMRKFLGSLMEIAQKKAKKPIFVKTMLAQVSPIAAENVTEWIWTTKSADAECFFVILPPEMLADFMEPTVMEARQSGLHCFLIPQGEIVSRLLYVDLMVELMLIKRKK